MLSNPFVPLKEAPKHTETDFHKDGDKYIITYGEKESVRILADEKDVDLKKDIDNYTVNKSVVEIDRVDRQEYLDSQSNDVGILNIIEKVRLSGDATLLNQTGRVPMAIVGKDALGHDVEEIVDVTKYQVDQVEALESYKVGAKAFDSLDPELKRKMSLEQVAKMTDSEIDAFLKVKIDAAKPKEKAAEGE